MAVRLPSRLKFERGGPPRARQPLAPDVAATLPHIPQRGWPGTRARPGLALWRASAAGATIGLIVSLRHRLDAESVYLPGVFECGRIHCRRCSNRIGTYFDASSGSMCGITL